MSGLIFTSEKYIIIITERGPGISQAVDSLHSFNMSEIECKQQINGSVWSVYSNKLRRTAYK